MQKTGELLYGLGGLETVKNVQNVSKSIGFLGTTCFIIDLSIIHEIIKSKAVKLQRISEMCKIQQLRMFGGTWSPGYMSKMYQNIYASGALGFTSTIIILRA